MPHFQDPNRMTVKTSPTDEAMDWFQREFAKLHEKVDRLFVLQQQPDLVLHEKIDRLTDIAGRPPVLVTAEPAALPAPSVSETTEPEDTTGELFG